MEKTSFTLRVLIAIWQSIMFSWNCISTGRYSMSHWRSSKPLKMRAEDECWNIEIALPVNVHLLPFRGFEILLFHNSEVHTTASLLVPTQYIKKLGPGGANLHIQQASFGLILIPVTSHLKGYSSSPLIVARLKGCKSKEIAPLDSGYRSECGSLKQEAS